MIYIVLGMHKSGTTLVARTLHESGIPMGEGFPVGASYRDMKYEAGWAQDINDTILGVDRKEFSLRVRSSGLAGTGINDELAGKMQEGVAGYSAKFDDWGFKDPRTALTYRFWRGNLPAHKVIVVCRDPLAVWRRYSRFISWRKIRSPFLAWHDYNRAILDVVSGLPDDEVLFLGFEQLLSGRDEWARLDRFTGKRLANVCDPKQSVNRFSETGFAALQYRMLKALAGRTVLDTYNQFVQLRMDQIARERSEKSD